MSDQREGRRVRTAAFPQLLLKSKEFENSKQIKQRLLVWRGRDSEITTTSSLIQRVHPLIEMENERRGESDGVGIF